MIDAAPQVNCPPCNYLIDTIAKIDRIQKEVQADVSTCVSCETSLFTSANNTIPVSFSACCGNTITGLLDLEGTTTQFFRIECLRERRFATLRLLEVTTVDDETTLTATNKTMILDCSQVITIQCFEPILVSLCFE